MTTLCTYQGIPVHACTFRRSRGWSSDVSTVTFLAKSFPSGFEFETPKPGMLARPRTQNAAWPDWDRPRGRDLFPRRLHWVGPLLLGERDSAGREYRVAVSLYCVAVETIRRDAGGQVSLVRAKLVDERYFWAQGFLRRWSFNRTGLDGAYAKDSLNEDGTPLTLAEIAKVLVRDLFDVPKLGSVPASWSTLTPEIECKPFGQARGALARIAAQHGGVEPCLNLDGGVSLWHLGEGKVGSGKGNRTPFPPDHVLYREGTGQAEGIEATYPPDWILVVGGLRIASVSLDDCGPVLVIQGEPVPLTEKTVRTLTKGKHGLKWLKAFVLAPQAWQNDTEVRIEVVQLFREQAWRLWRIPGVEAEVDAKVPTEVIRSWLSDQRQRSRAATTRVPGPNAHVLPLRPRAETVAGRRLPVRVETYRFGSVHVAMSGAPEQQASTTGRQRLSQLRDQIEAVARVKGDPSPWNQVDWFLSFSERYASLETLASFAKEIQGAGVSHEEFANFLNHARLLDRISEVGSDLASTYDGELTTLYDLDGKLGGVSPELWKLAKELIAAEKLAAEQRDSFESVDEELNEQREALEAKLAGTLRDLRRKDRDRQRRSRVGARKRLQPQTAQFLRNFPRKEDPHAGVYSAELGIVRTAELCGHVLDPGVPVAEATTFVPKPPRVVFGAVVRPRLTTRRPMTGNAPPGALSDRETYFTSAYRRLGAGAVRRVDVESIPPGLGFPIARPDLVELIPLNGAGNRPALERTAEAVAQELTRQRPTQRSGRITLARPWPVECNGVVSAVEITLRPGGKGFQTTVFLGGEGPPALGGGRSRERTPPLALSDAANRKGAS